MSLNLSNTGKEKPKTKHIDLRYHLTKDYVAKQLIKLTHIPSKEIAEDSLTKALC